MNKICRKCGLDKPLDDYHKSNVTKDKRQCYCKACNKLVSTPDKKRYYNKVRQSKREDPEYKQKEYDKGKQRRISYRANYLLKDIRNRCLAKGIPFNLVVDDIIIPDICPILKVPLTKESMSVGDWYAPSVDRIIPELGYVKGNICVMSRKANIMKNNASLEELESFCLAMLDMISFWKK